MSVNILIKALEDIKDTAKSWEGRDKVPYWNLGDKAKNALRQYNNQITLAPRGRSSG